MTTDTSTPHIHPINCGIWDSPVGGVSGWCDCGIYAQTGSTK